MKRWKALRTLVVGGRRPSSTRAAEQLVERHYATVYNLAYRTLGQRQDAEDIAQQTFLRALPRLDELDGQDAAGWLCRVAANLCIDELRRSKRRYSADQLPDEVWDELASPVPFGAPEATIEQREVRLAVWRATLALPPQQRLALALREWHGMSYAQIASALATSVSAVETLLFRARQGFRRAYEQRPAQPVADDAGCAWCLERLSASVDGELSVAERHQVDVHIERCPMCRFAADQLGTTSRLYALVPLFMPALPAKAALLTAISGVGAAGVGAVLKVVGAGAGAADAAASHASGGLTDVGWTVTIGTGTAAVAGAATGSGGAIGAGSAAAGLGSSATVAGAAGLAGASVVASGAVGAGAAGAMGSTGVSSAVGSSAVAGAASALGAAKSGVAVVAVAAAISAAVWSGSQPEPPAPLTDEAAVVSQAPAALASLDARLGLTGHASWTPPTTVAIESDATEADAGQPADAGSAPASLAMTIAHPSQVANDPAQAAEPDVSNRQRRAEDSPAAQREKNQQELSVERRPSQAQHDVSSQARGQTDHRNGDDNSPQASKRADRRAQAEDPSRTSNREFVQASGEQSTEAGHDLSEQARASESTPFDDTPSEETGTSKSRQVRHDQSAQIGSRPSMPAAVDQARPGRGDDGSPTPGLEAGRLAQVGARSEAGEDGHDTAQRQLPALAAAVMAAPEHHAGGNVPHDDGGAEDRPLSAWPQLTGSPQQVAPIRTGANQRDALKRLDDREARPGGNEPRHSAPDRPDSRD